MVYIAQKEPEIIDNIFTSIHKKYDMMNDVMSFGYHRRVKRNAMSKCKSGNLLDLASGTGDLALYFKKIFGDANNITLADPNYEMLKYAKKRLKKKNLLNNTDFVPCYAEALPFNEKSFDNVSIGFGFRNFNDKNEALAEIFRVLKDNGRLIIIDFSKPINKIVKSLAALYFDKIIPLLAKIISGNSLEYHYLAQSIKHHPDQQEIIKMLQAKGFRNCSYENILNGMIAVHIGEK